MRVGMVSFAHMHAYSYLHCLKQIPGVEVLGFSDDDAVRAQSVVQDYGLRYYPSTVELLDARPDCILVCSENTKHLESVLLAAQRGVDVLCEKPIATTLSDAWKMVGVAEASGIVLATAFPVRFSTPVRRAKQFLDAGQMGRLVAMRGTNHGQNPGGWFVDPALSGGGAVLDHTVHVLDLMRWFVGSEVCEVYAEVGTRFSDIPTEDCGLLTFEFASGVIAMHDPSWSRPKSNPTWGDVTLELIGTDGVLRVDAFAEHLDWYDDRSRMYRHDHYGDSTDLNLVLDFLTSVRTRRRPSATGLDGLRALEVALAAYQSARDGAPVRLDLK
ncbi:MAG: Gfo/Idh/MocA family oxidoreductase [Alicyclobacillaceae bacterium]|nr:Gfo/Idh/MocA family oxidoreductase [Alicyclobacillaceae bacterium]